MSELDDIYLLMIALDKYFLQDQFEELLVFPEVYNNKANIFLPLMRVNLCWKWVQTS